MAATVAQSASIWVSVARIVPLDANGNLIADANVFVTNTPVKVTLTPVVETGDDIAVKNANGDLIAWGKHGDMIKYATVSIELGLPDPYLEQVLAGGTVLNDTSAALGAPTGLSVATQTTLGTLAAATYGYKFTQGNSYGESLASSEVTVTTTGATSANVLTGFTFAAGATYGRVYGRTPGAEQFMGTIWNIGSQATSAASGTGSVSSLAVTALTKPIPANTTFQIAGDTNTTKIVFTVLVTAAVGATSISVSVSQTVTTTIAAGAINLCFVDNNTVTPLGVLPTTDLTAGPGNDVGYLAPALGPVGNPNGVSLELFSKRIINGQQATDYPYWRTVLPMVKNLHVMPRDYTNANLQNIFEGQAFANANWNQGPVGDWQFASTSWVQRAVCGAQIVPAPSVVPVGASY